ncbi:hypothetical protein HPB51_028674 [Rhipicephalus microplus]|uniref:Uncharacterized protein n=1 Tax=Rhipicephalus microplus TaxID=6941 RepID=A0A9J6CWY6_RHIMP|nr:hypothetical protein HPB51_028674 [Rhipicephalus microplus]
MFPGKLVGIDSVPPGTTSESPCHVVRHFVEVDLGFVQLSHVAYMVPSCGMIAVAYLVQEPPCWLLAFSEMCCAENARAASSHRVEPCLLRHRLSALRVEMCRQHEQLVVHREQEGPNSIISDHVSIGIWGFVELFYTAFSSVPATNSTCTGHVLRVNERARSAFVVMPLPCVVADGYALTRAGRRLSSAASMLALSIATGALSAVNVLGAPDQLDADLAVSGLQVQDMSAITAFAFSAELYPTVLRGSAFGCCYKSGSISAFAASFVNAVRSPPLKALVAPRWPPCYSSSL